MEVPPSTVSIADPDTEWRYPLPRVAPRSVRPLEPHQLAVLTTARLLAYQDKLLALEQSAELSDWEQHELAALDPSKVYFKDDPRWQRAYAELKEVLWGREHVERRGLVRGC